MKKTVCPTYVGMNRHVRRGSVSYQRMPHVCGDEPILHIFHSDASLYAPRMWG